MIWIVGNKGMLGSQLSELMSDHGLAHIGTDRELSILDPDALEAFVHEHNPAWIINCAAYTAVDRAEDEPETAHALNADGPANLAKVADQTGAALVHLSTDYVFDGLGINGIDGKPRAYRETDPVNPQGVYGASKAAGEQLVRESFPKHIILRTAWLYGRYGPNFVYTMLRLMRQRESLGIVADQKGSPTWARDLAAVIVALIQTPEPLWGTFQYSGDGVTSWYDFAVEIHRLARIAGILERDCTLNALTSDQYPAKVRRPAWSVLDKSAIISAYGSTIHGWKDSLAMFIANIAKDWPENPLIVPKEGR